MYDLLIVCIYITFHVHLFIKFQIYVVIYKQKTIIRRINISKCKSMLARN